MLMTRDAAKEYVKGQLEQYLRGRGIEPGKAFTCLSPDHADKHPSMHYDRERQRVYCFSCKAAYDTFDLIGLDRGITDAAEKFRAAYDYYGIELQGGAGSSRQASRPGSGDRSEPQQRDSAQAADYTELYRKWADNIENTDYLQRRGISEKTARRFMVGYCHIWKHPKAPHAPASPRLIIPTGRGSYLARDTRPAAEIPDAAKPYTKSKVGKAAIFNAKALRQATRPIFITEGEIDALSIIEVGGEAIALGSVSYTDMLLTLLEAERPQQPLILALDNDSAGAKATDKLKAAFKKQGLRYCCLEALPTKDANELLLKDRETLLQAVQRAEANATKYATNAEAEAAEAAETYTQKSNYYHLQSFLDGIRNTEGRACLPTGLPALDSALDGGIYTGLYVIGAIPSLGKTTFALQIADYIAAQKTLADAAGEGAEGAGRDILFISLEQSREELIAKSLSRYSYVLEQGGYIDGGHYLDGCGAHYARTVRDITIRERLEAMTDKQAELLDAAQAEYETAAQSLYVQQGLKPGGGLSQVRELVDTHTKARGAAPMVILDYLQILSLEAGLNTERQNVDATILELKSISRDYNTPVLAISSFSRGGYKIGADMAQFKESGAIEYSADVLLTLQYKGQGEKDFDLQAAKAAKPREIELIVLKSRLSSTDDTVNLYFVPMFNYFTDRDTRPIPSPGAGYTPQAQR